MSRAEPLLVAMVDKYLLVAASRRVPGRDYGSFSCSVVIRRFCVSLFEFRTKCVSDVSAPLRVTRG